jgi:hypothetical protein
VAKRDPDRARRLRIAVRYLLERGGLVPGSQSQLARHFKVSRQRVNQIVAEERAHLQRHSDFQGTQPSSS